MARRNPRPPAPALPGAPSFPSPGSRSTPSPVPRNHADSEDARFAAAFGELLRRIALGAAAALLTSRAYWPSEPDLQRNAGTGLIWAFAVFVVAGLALASSLVSGRLRMRWSWADAAVILLFSLVGLSVRNALDYRPAVNLAWEWAAYGVIYLLIRNLPRTRGESVTIAGAVVATAFAVAIYGLYQAGVEFPEMQRKFQANPLEALRLVGITPGTAAASHFKDRLLGSNEVYSTFALANSLAGFLVGPVVILLSLVWQNLTRRDGSGSRGLALTLALPAVLVMLVCLTLTKSRSASIGLLAGILILAWNERTRVRKRTLALGAGTLLLVFAGLIGLGLATGRLDPLVLTQSGKSLQYRREYWVGAWKAIHETSRAFWGGYGPGNFSAAYVRHKLPQASEEIQDPHNFLLEVWATAGFWAVLALACALLLALFTILGRSSRTSETLPNEPNERPLRDTNPTRRDPSAPPRSPAWLLVSGAGGLVLVLVVGQVRLIEGGDFDRWLILLASWGIAVGCGFPLWRRRPLPVETLGAAAVAVLVNLLAAGGIGIAMVALGLWSTLALGLNLRDDRNASQVREVGGRLPAFGLAVVWVALLGSFVGAVTPYWKAEAALADAEAATRTRPPDLERAEASYERAKLADKFDARPYLGLAALDYQVWLDRGANFKDQRWKKIPIEMFKAVQPPRSTVSWTRHRERAFMTSLLLKQIGNALPPLELTRYRGNVVEASRKAALLYPNNPDLRARLAEASADIGYIPDALKEAQEALRLDALTPHADKKLEPEVRLWLSSRIPDWERTKSQVDESIKPKPKPTR